MNTMRKLSALLAAGALLVALSGIASAASVVPTFHAGNITIAGGGGNDAAACDPKDALFYDADEDGAQTTDNGVEVTITYNTDPADGGFDFVASGGVVTIVYVKGSSGYYEYDYGAGVVSDDDLYAPDAGGSGQAAAVSHLVICTAVTTTTTTTTEETTTTTTEETTTTTEETTTTTTEETTTTTTEETTTTTTFTQDTGGETDAPTLPPTSTSGGGASGPSDASWLLVAALGVLLAGAVILTPARVTSRR